METELVPCPACQRHARATERACPFCDAALPARAAMPPAGPAPRLSRAALMVLGASLAAAGCSGPPAAVYGGPPPASEQNAGGESAGGPADGGGVVAIYGAPAPTSEPTR